MIREPFGVANPFYYGERDGRQPFGVAMQNHFKKNFWHEGKFYDRSNKKYYKKVLGSVKSFPMESSSSLVVSPEVE